MVTPTPSRARTTEDLFAAIHRYIDAFTSFFSPTVTPTSSLLTCFNSWYIISSTELVYFSSRTLVFCLFFPPSWPSLSVTFSFPLSHPLIKRITLNSKLLLPLHPSTHNFSFPSPSPSSSPSSPRPALYLSVITLPSAVPSASIHICQIASLWSLPAQERVAFSVPAQWGDWVRKQNLVKCLLRHPCYCTHISVAHSQPERKGGRFIHYLNTRHPPVLI